MFGLNEEITLGLVLIKVLGPVVSSCLKDSNSWLSKKLGPNDTATVAKIVDHLTSKVQSVDVDHETKKIS